MKLLALETATDACSVALLEGERVVERHLHAPRRHAELVLTLVAEVLDEAGVRLGELDALAFGRGPGSFTGVRIATGVVQGLAYGAGLPVVGVSSLAALAQGALRERGGEGFLAAFDARMDEVYWGAFSADADGLVMPRGAETVVSPDAVARVPAGDWLGVGDGWAVHGERLRARLGVGLSACEADRLPRARDVAVLGEWAYARGEAVAASQALPVYLRDRVTRTAAGKR